MFLPSAPRIVVDVFFFVVHVEFEVGVLAPEEFRLKIFLGEDLELYGATCCTCVSFAWGIVRDSPTVNFDSQTMTWSSVAKSMLPGNAKCSMTSLADTKHIFRERKIYLFMKPRIWQLAKTTRG